ncbi:MAG: nucleotide exchange factor GrpE [Phycisphaerae bacterium]
MSKRKPRIQIPTAAEAAEFGRGQAAPHTESEGAAATTESRSDVERLQAELREANDRYLRAKAEAQNISRRLTEEKEAAVRYANAAFAKALLCVWDNFERTLANTKDHHQDDPVIQGVRLVYDLFAKAMAEHGVEPIEAVGAPFDPALHEALMQQASETLPPGTVISECERGYRMKDRVIRASKVVVAAETTDGSGTPADEQSSSADCSTHTTEEAPGPETR